MTKPLIPPDASRFTPADQPQGTRASDDGLAILAPLSFAQAWLWYLDQLAPGRAAYCLTNAWRVDGPLDSAVLHRSLQWMVDRHAALRTTIVTVDGEPVQRIAHRQDVEFSVVDLTGSPREEREPKAREIFQSLLHRAVDLARGPLFVATVLKLGAEQHLLALNRHHAISGGKRAIIVEELELAYNAFRDGHAPAALPLPRQYFEFALWQRERLQGRYLEELQAYWRRRLAGAPTELIVATDRRRPPASSGSGARVPVVLSAELIEGLRALGRSTGATLHMTLLAAFQVLLSRYTGQHDILVGAPVAGRPGPEYEDVLGMFVNLVVHRGELGADPSFRSLLASTRATATEAYAHDELPIGLVIQALAPERRLGVNPLFQAMYSLQPQYEDGAHLHLAGLAARPLPTYNGTAKVDLALLLVREPAGVRGMFEYSTDLFAAPTIERMAVHYVRLLEAMLREPDRPVSTLSLLDPATRHTMLVDWNATRSPFPAERGVHELFALQACRRPQAIALAERGRSLDYATLDRRSDALARLLLDAGITPGSRVAICIGRAVESVIAMLAILKAGCAYVPLAPGQPAQRVAALLRNAEVVAALTVASTSPAVAVWRTQGARPVFELDRLDLASAAVPPVSVATQGGDVACIMYTSGSTGEPKGVAVPHRAIARLVLGTDYVQLGETDVVAHLANPAFDAATFEIWGPLLNGGRIALLTTETALSPEDFVAALDHHGVTTLFLTTALINHIVSEMPRALRDRVVLFGGEAADPERVRACLVDARPRRLLHVYGPTETTTFATWHEVTAVAPEAPSVPIGRPLANTELYVLDEHRNPVAIDLPGELYIGGPGVALGYVNAPEATAQRFVAHPFDGTTGMRLYRTGDRVRYRADGTLEFLGRFDRQVKIRGYRIEPVEVELALRRHPAVRDATVKVLGSTAEDRRLAAYVVPSPGARVTPEDLWRFLGGTLPDYLVPGAYVLLQALPLTPSGKIDHAALPDPDDLATQRRGFHVPPRNPLEAELVQTWSSLLGKATVGVRDDFFDLGGHSLLAARMIAEVERACGVRVPLPTLYAGATIEHLAEVIRGAATAADPRMVVLQATGTRPPLFFLHGDFTGGGFYTRNLAQSLGPDQPFYAVHPHGLDGAPLPPSIEAMAADCLQAIRRVRPHGPYALGGHCAGAHVALEIARLLIDAGETVVVVVVVDAAAPGPQGIPTGGRPGGAAPNAPGEAADDAFQSYVRLLGNYRPARHAARVVVLCSEAARAARQRLAWEAVCADLRVEDIPGDHFTALTRHADELGRRMRAAVDDALAATKRS